MLNPRTQCSEIDFGNMALQIQNIFGIIFADISTTFRHIRSINPLPFQLQNLNDLYCGMKGFHDFLIIYESLVVSEASVERIFSYFRRCEATFMRK